MRLPLRGKIKFDSISRNRADHAASCELGGGGADGATHPETAEHLVDQELDLLLGELTLHLGQVGKHVGHHQVAARMREGP